MLTAKISGNLLGNHERPVNDLKIFVVLGLRSLAFDILLILLIYMVSINNE